MKRSGHVFKHKVAEYGVSNPIGVKDRASLLSNGGDLDTSDFPLTFYFPLLFSLSFKFYVFQIFQQPMTTNQLFLFFLISTFRFPLHFEVELKERIMVYHRFFFFDESIFILVYNFEKVFTLIVDLQNYLLCSPLLIVI